jgi:hypothetical protein
MGFRWTPILVGGIGGSILGFTGGFAWAKFDGNSLRDAIRDVRVPVLSLIHI